MMHITNVVELKYYVEVEDMVNIYGYENEETTQMEIICSTSIQLDVDLLNMRSSNPHAKTPILGKPSKSGLIGV
jgi:hypothetical protein